MRIVRTGILVLLAVLWTTLSPAEGIKAGADTNSPSVQQILEKYRQAIGGQALDGLKSITRKGILIRGIQGRVPFVAYADASGKWYYQQLFAYGDVVCYASDGKQSWVQDTKEVNAIQEPECSELRLLFDLALLRNLQDQYPDMRVKEGISPDDTIITLLAKAGNGTETELDFDLRTGFLVRAGELFFEDYRETENLHLPYRVYIGKDLGEALLRLKMEFTTVTFNEPIDQTFFYEPGCPAKPRKSVLYTLRKQVTVSEAVLDGCVGVYRHPADSTVTYTISRQQNHLMFEVTNRSPRMEIKPESELDYFIRFLNLEFHFVKDNNGNVVQLEIGSEKRAVAKRIH